jgi:acetyl esterase/lipase
MRKTPYSGANCEKGGWVLGGLQSEAAWCRHMCNMANITIIDVDYRMGPEYKFPAAIYDCWDAVKWVSLALGSSSSGPGAEMTC